MKKTQSEEFLEKYNSYDLPGESSKIKNQLSNTGSYDFGDNISIHISLTDVGNISKILVSLRTYDIESTNMQLFYDVISRVLYALGSSSPASDMPSTLNNDTVYIGGYSCYYNNSFVY